MPFAKQAPSWFRVTGAGDYFLREFCFSIIAFQAPAGNILKHFSGNALLE
jgi:hypothetical protein